jgi:hypothetical protein
VEHAEHAAEPEAGSLRTTDGREADLFTLTDYPIDATCRICRRTIRAQSFMRPFEHLADGPGRVPHQAAARGSRPGAVS